MNDIFKPEVITNWPARIYETYQKTSKEGEKGVRNIDILGMGLAVYPNVFAPDIFANSKYFAENTLKILAELRQSGSSISSFLEMGCGTGLTALAVAKYDTEIKSVVVSDINPNAVANVRHNAENLGLNVESYQSDCFDNIPTQEFDVICWWILYNPVAPLGNDVDSDLLKGGYDPSYQSLNKFLSQAKDYLSANGIILLGVGKNVINQKLIDDLLEQNGWIKELKPRASFEIPLQVGTREPKIINQIIALKPKKEEIKQEFGNN